MNCPGAPVNLLERKFCAGPLKGSILDSSKAPASLVPLLGDGSEGDPIAISVPGYEDAKFTVISTTRGPKIKYFVSGTTDFIVPSFAQNTPHDGIDGWWKVWNRDVVQDYRRFNPVHSGQANILFADGSVREFTDKNKDGVINNGFDLRSSDRSASAPPGFGGIKSIELDKSNQVIPEMEIFSLYSLDAFKGK